MALDQNSVYSLLGKYESIGDKYSLTIKNNNIEMERYIDLHKQRTTCELQPLEGGLFAMVNNHNEITGKIKFLGKDSDGSPGYLYSSDGRIHRRIQ